MRDEDLDWEIYHALLYGKVGTARDLVAAGYDHDLVEASLGRLERYHLIERRGEVLRALSLPESILLCHLNNEEDSPLIFDKGIIRLKTEKGRKG